MNDKYDNDYRDNDVDIDDGTNRRRVEDKEDAVHEAKLRRSLVADTDEFWSEYKVSRRR